MPEENDESKPDTDGTTPKEPAKDKGAVPAAQETPTATPEETKAKSTAMIDSANEAAERMERANKKREELLQRDEALKVEKTLGGVAEASVPPKEESAADYAKKVMANDVNPTKS